MNANRMNVLDIIEQTYGFFTTVWISQIITVTHLPLEKIAIISQSIFSDAFSWKKVLYFD